MKLFRKKFVVALAAAGVLVGAGLVYAAWTSSGTGAVYSKAGTAQAISTVDVSASTGATLYPGVSGDALVKFSNPNPYPVFPASRNPKKKKKNGPSWIPACCISGWKNISMTPVASICGVL